ncbi:chaoptin [Nilaparvata lugens]|uniref:Toll-13 n=1 Tax=Nilaparvata lugens TaxID=108931 RepID=N0A0P9_NILLU|nr:chaoptin [Nilaparvata lugens]AGK40893.1 toll-13 [Nilaparvata lugens]
MIAKSIITLVALLAAVKGELADLECPDDCDCHYFRINWVTDCSESNLTEIPTPDDGLSLNVYILNMNANELTAIAPFPADIKLRRLQLADNKLTHITKDDFAGLGFLLEIDLSENKITSVHPDAFRDSPGLITLEMQMNPLDPVEGPFLISRSLLYLDLSDCKLEKLTPQFFQNLTTLNKLDLSGNPLKELHPSILDPLISLEVLNLNRCNLTYISNDAFKFTEHLKYLEIAENNLMVPTDWIAVLGALGRLEYLDLRQSAISNLPEDAFNNNTWLRSLILAGNDLMRLEISSILGDNPKHLEYLDLSNCHFSGRLTANAFTNCTKLKTLILSGNLLSAADLAEALPPLSKLQKLGLKNCNLTRLPANTFHNLENLQELDISRNPLNNAFTELLSPLTSLERLDMSYSNLGHISQTTFSNMDALRTLILSGNKLTSLESGLFEKLTHLETLELNNCGLKSLSSTVFPENFTYPDLEELRLAGNPLEISEEGMLLPVQIKRLKTLDLSDCNLTYIPPDTLKSFVNITRLQLAGNKFNSSVGNSLEFLRKFPQLEFLDLSRNELTDITPSVFDNNTLLSALKLVGNPWKCGCHIADMWEWAITVKGDLGVLIGSTTDPEAISTGGRKKKKGLLCHFDSKTSPISKDIQFRKPARKDSVDNVNRTWARYVREADCESSARLRPARLLKSQPITV